MPLMELTRTNQEFVLAAADLIEKLGKATGTYEDRDTGACCILGAFRKLITHNGEIYTLHEEDPRRLRYFELTIWLSFRLDPTLSPSRNFDPGKVVASWSDLNDKETVVSKLREIGRAD